MDLRTLIVDDSAHFLAAAREFLERDGVTVVGVASTGDEAVTLAHDLRPDVALVDIDLGEESGFDVARRLTGPGSEQPTRVVLISAYPERDFADLIVQSPAVGFLPKPDVSADRIRALLVDGADPGETRSA